jgi:hypothetical protein
MLQGADPERFQGDVELGADPAHFALGDPRLEAERGHEVIDLAGTHTVHVRLDHHREQRPIDATAALQDAGEEGPRPQLRDLQLDITGLRRQQPRSGAVALVRALRGPLMRLRADHLAQLRVDQGLEHELHTGADHINITTRADRVEQVDQVRLGQGHVLLLSRVPR